MQEPYFFKTKFMVTIEINCSKYCSAFMTSKFGVEGIKSGILKQYILSVLQQTNVGNNTNYYKKKSMLHKVRCSIPIHFKKNHGPFDEQKLYKISRYLESYFQTEFVTYVSSQINSGVSIRNSIFNFIDYFDLPENLKSVDALLKLYQRKGKKEEIIKKVSFKLSLKHTLHTNTTQKAQSPYANILFQN